MWKLLLAVSIGALAGCVEPPSALRVNDAPTWAPANEAVIRPGILIESPEAVCTASFLFENRSDGRAFLSTASHCFPSHVLGVAVSVGGQVIGRLRYDSFLLMEQERESDPEALMYNDFALIELSNDSRAKANAAVTFFGGPTELVPSSSIPSGARIVSYGASSLRDPAEEVGAIGTDADAQRGLFLERVSKWRSRIYEVSPGLPGDSGAPVMTASGAAVGLAVAWNDPGAPGSNEITNLDAALGYARENTDLDLRLVTAHWEAKE